MNRIKKAIEWCQAVKRVNNELLWAQIYHDTKDGISWMNNMPSISPGRWAVGYNFLYVMTRILNDIRPKRILEFGLGISTSLITTYVNNVEDKDLIHIIIEHDKNWVDFYTRSHRLSDKSSIQLHEIEYYDHKDCARYKDLHNTLDKQKFEVISIDAPFGSDRSSKNLYNRADLVEFLPYILEKDFIIIYDDANRQGEKNTIGLIEKKLMEAGIKYSIGIYEGQKKIAVIVSESYKFLCSL